MIDDDRQLAIPGVQPGAQLERPAGRRVRAVHFTVTIRTVRAPIRVSIDGAVVRFRPRGSHAPLDLEFSTWVGLGFWHAAKAAAAAAKAERAKRRQLRKVGAA